MVEPTPLRARLFRSEDFKHNLIAFFWSVWMLRVHQQRAEALVALHARDADPQALGFPSSCLRSTPLRQSHRDALGAESVESLERTCLFFFFALCVIDFRNDASCTVNNIRIDFNPFH